MPEVTQAAFADPIFSSPTTSADDSNPDSLIFDDVGVKIDVRAAYKRVRVRPDQVRYLLFFFRDLFYHWNVLPFGHSVSALWWQRTGALFGRIASWLLDHPHFRFLYVDDYLWRFPRALAARLTVLTIFIFEILGVPVAYSKIEFGYVLSWVGYLLNFSSRTCSLPIIKREKLHLQL